MLNAKIYHKTCHAYKYYKTISFYASLEKTSMRTFHEKHNFVVRLIELMHNFRSINVIETILMKPAKYK